jgi:hypothetical protein
MTKLSDTRSMPTTSIQHRSDLPDNSVAAHGVPRLGVNAVTSGLLRSETDRDRQ